MITGRGLMSTQLLDTAIRPIAVAKWRFIIVALILTGTMEACDDAGGTPSVALETESQLGEGALWDHRTDRLLWVDIERRSLHIFDPATGDNQTITTNSRIGTVVPCTSGTQVIAALEDGIFSLDLRSGERTLIVHPEVGDEGQRYNDGKCDPQGRLWVGSLNMDGQEGVSALYRVDSDGSARKMVGGVSISNGIVWSIDGRTMYYIDTPTQQVVAYDFDGATGNISNRRVVVQVPGDMGSPDGMTIDEAGKLWIAHWGGYGVYRWDPDTGELLRKISVPAKQVTSCAFGGADLDILYITTARVGLERSHLEQYPLSGRLFYIRPGVSGVHSTAYLGCL